MAGAALPREPRPLLEGSPQLLSPGAPRWHQAAAAWPWKLAFPALGSDLSVRLKAAQGLRQQGGTG